MKFFHNNWSGLHREHGIDHPRGNTKAQQVRFSVHRVDGLCYRWLWTHATTMTFAGFAKRGL